MTSSWSIFIHFFLTSVEFPVRYLRCLSCRLFADYGNKSYLLHVNKQKLEVVVTNSSRWKRSPVRHKNILDVSNKARHLFVRTRANVHNSYKAPEPRRNKVYYNKVFILHSAYSFNVYNFRQHGVEF